MQVYIYNDFDRKLNIYVYSKQDIDHTVTFCKLGKEEENTHPLQKSMKRIFSQIKNYLNYHKGVFKDDLYIGEEMEFEDRSGTWFSAPHFVFEGWTQTNEFTKAAMYDRELSYYYDIKGTNVKIKGTFFTKEDRVVIRVLLSATEIY